MQFIFLNTKEFEMKRNKVIVRFGLMHMLATNLCEWLYVLVEETRHEIGNNIENATGKYLEYTRAKFVQLYFGHKPNHRNLFFLSPTLSFTLIKVFFSHAFCVFVFFSRCKCGTL